MQAPRAVVAAALAVWLLCAGKTVHSVAASRGGQPTPQPVAVVVDADAAVLDAGGLDVDDDLALTYALTHPDINVTAITTTAGNSDTTSAFASAAAIAAAVGSPGTPVVHSCDAPRFLCDTFRTAAAANTTIVLVALGPLTNLAGALALCGAGVTEAAVSRLVLMGGDLATPLAHLSGSRATPGPWWTRLWRHLPLLPPLPDVDLNFVLADSAATAAVLGTRVPKAVVPVQACLQVAFTPAHRAAFEASCDTRQSAVCGALASKLVAKRATLTRRLVSHVMSGAGYDVYASPLLSDAGGGFVPWDLVAMGLVAVPEAYTDWSWWHATVRPDGWGMAWRRLASTPTALDAVVRIPLRVDAAAMLQDFVDATAAVLPSVVPSAVLPPMPPPRACQHTRPPMPQIRQRCPLPPAAFVALLVAAASTFLCVVRCSPLAWGHQPANHRKRD